MNKNTMLPFALEQELLTTLEYYASLINYQHTVVIGNTMSSPIDFDQGDRARRVLEKLRQQCR